MERKSFIFYASFWDAISDVEDDLRLHILEAVINYGLYGKEPNLKGVNNTLWKLIKPQLEANNRRYVAGCKGKDYGHLGGRPKPQPNPTGVKNKTPNDNDNDNVKVKDKDKYTCEFELLWKDYPNRPNDGKSLAYKKYKLSLKHYKADDIHQACMNYASTVNDKAYIRALTTLLTGNKFEDFLTATSYSGGQQVSLGDVLEKVVHPDDRFRARALYNKRVNEDAFRKITGYGFSQIGDAGGNKSDGGLSVL